MMTHKLMIYVNNKDHSRSISPTDLVFTETTQWSQDSLEQDIGALGNIEYYNHVILLYMPPVCVNVNNNKSKFNLFNKRM